MVIKERLWRKSGDVVANLSIFRTIWGFFCYLLLNGKIVLERKEEKTIEGQGDED